MSFLYKSKIFWGNQFDFRLKYSGAQALLELTETLRKDYDKKHTTQACFVDLSKAFDTINHEKLIQKLEINGFRGKILDLMKSYLPIRYFNMKIKIIVGQNKKFV